MPMRLLRLVLFVLVILCGFIPETSYAAEGNQSRQDTSHFKVDFSNFRDGNQGELDRAAEKEFKRADDTLNDIYNKVLLKHKNDQEFIDKFINAELAWIKFRDAELEAIYPSEDKQRYGSVYPMAYFIEKANLTWDRVKQLNVWLEGLPEGVVGAGSR